MSEKTTSRKAERREMKSIKGYKVFNKDWTRKGQSYKVGDTIKHDGELRMCESGLHFCVKLSDCFKYYPFSQKNDKGVKVAEVVSRGRFLSNKEDSKKCTNKLEVVRELDWKEVLLLVNEGSDNIGIGLSLIHI